MNPIKHCHPGGPGGCEVVSPSLRFPLSGADPDWVHPQPIWRCRNRHPQGRPRGSLSLSLGVTASGPPAFTPTCPQGNSPSPPSVCRSHSHSGSKAQGLWWACWGQGDAHADKRLRRKPNSQPGAPHVCGGRRAPGVGRATLLPPGSESAGERSKPVVLASKWHCSGSCTVPWS